MKFYEVVTVKSTESLVKEDVIASNIELITFEENDFKVVAAKDVWQKGMKGLYLFPDINLPDTPVFEDYHKPSGNANKTKLGTNGRVKAVKFNWFDSNGRKAFSEGILLPNDLADPEMENPVETLGLFKDDSDARQAKKQGTPSGITKGNFPSNIVKSDEDNIKQVVKYFSYPIELMISRKRDGSSGTAYWESEEVFGAASRNLEKKLDCTEKTYPGFRKHYNKDTKENGWLNIESQLFYTPSQMDENLFVFEEKIMDDEFTIIGKRILKVLQEKKAQYAIRYEIFGTNMNAHKVNPDCKLPLQFEVYGVDELVNGKFVRVPQFRAMEIAKELGFPTVEVFEHRVFESKEDIESTVHNIFSKELFEGVVLRTPYDNGVSCKFINPEYDERK